MADKTPQQKGYEWDAELAEMIGGKAHKGSGNTVFQKLDASGSGLVFSGKHTENASITLKEDHLQEMDDAVSGMSSAGSGQSIPILAIRFGQSGRKVAVIDLDQLLEWISSPPQIIEHSKRAATDAIVRTPPFLR